MDNLLTCNVDCNKIRQRWVTLSFFMTQNYGQCLVINGWTVVYCLFVSLKFINLLLL